MHVGAHIHLLYTSAMYIGACLLDVLLHVAHACIIYEHASYAVATALFNIFYIYINPSPSFFTDLQPLPIIFAHLLSLSINFY